MAKKPVEIGRFGFGLVVLKYPDGRIEYRTSSENRRVPIEIAIMQMRAFLKNLEKDYFDNFYQRTSKFKKD